MTVRLIPGSTVRSVVRWVVRSIVRLIVAVVALAIVTGAPSPALARAASERSFSLASLDTTADVRADGSMAVTEVITYDFAGGPFNFGIRTFEHDLAAIRDFAAADAQGPLSVIPPRSSESGHWEWRLRGPETDVTRTYTITYVVDTGAAVRAGSDVGELNWQFIGTDHPGIGRMSVTVRLPTDVPAAHEATPDTDTTVLRAWGHGPTHGEVRLGPSGVVAEVSGVAPRQFVELHVVIPLRAFTIVGTEPLLPSILELERRLDPQDSSVAGNAAVDAAERHDLAWFLSPVLSAIALVGTGVTWLVAGREPKSTEVLGDYWREPLEDPPAVALTNLHRGTVPVGAAFAGTIVDLAQRGYLRINAVREERFGPDKTVHHYQWMGRPLGPEVLPFERLVLDFVFRGRPSTSADELTTWARKNQRQAKSELDAISGAIKAEYRQRNYEARSHRGAGVALVAVCVAVGVASWFLRDYTDNGIMWVGVGAAFVALFAGRRLLMNRTQTGADAAAKATGLREFLKDFSRLEDAPIGHLILWERYLVFAVALGVADDLLDGLGARLPGLLADPGFSTWYAAPHGAHHRFDGFGDVVGFGTSVVSASTPKSSGSGGGFSGGSSGGGGGGGFGAR